ncbi:hypothetical protein STENM327S_01128 [Streptomyces tendae]
MDLTGSCPATVGPPGSAQERTFVATATRRTTAHSTATPAPRTGPGRPPAPVALGLALAVLATLVWSGSFVTSRALGDSVPPVQHAFWRWVVALAVVAPFGARRAWRQRALIRRHLGFVLLASLLGVTETTPWSTRPESPPPPPTWA